MFKRFLVLVAVLVGLSASAKADSNLTLGNVAFSIPHGWKQVTSTDDRLTFAAPDGRQQATISIMRLSRSPTFQEFDLLCAHRYDAEKNGVSDLTLVPKDPAPRNESGRFAMTFSGTENPNGRVFSGFLWIKGAELVTVYVEGIGVGADTNSDAFKAIVASLK